jgi:ribonuclease BN (tRNA processing enzyme)
MSRTPVTITFLGCGDAFGSGGRLQACFLVASGEHRYLIDCGASSLSAMKRRGVEPAEIDAIVVSHLHGDHFGGIPFLLLDARWRAGRSGALSIAGPPGIEARVREAMDVLFPGSSGTDLGFPLEFVELVAGSETSVSGIAVTPWEVAHESGAPAFALRVRCGGKVIAYSGDTEWTDALREVARDADLFLCEAYFYEKNVPHHLSYATLMAHRAELACRRLVLTHLSEELLGRAADLEAEVAEEGAAIEL